jgi:glycine cleavage system H protein
VEYLGCRVPDDLRVDVENGVWLRPEPDGRVTLGLLAPFLAFAGRVSALTFRPDRVPLEAGRSVAMIESARLTAPVRTPIPGEVLDRHQELARLPRPLHEDPYGAGWLVRIQPSDASVGRLPTASEAREAIERQIDERRIRCYAALPDLEVYEIGAECRAILVRLDEELGRRAVGEVVLLVVDDPTAPIEMVRWSDRTGYPILEQRRTDGLWHFLVRKVPDPRPRPRAGATGP